MTGRFFGPKEANVVSVAIRSLARDEFDSFLRFLERCYGHSYGFFPRAYPDLYTPDVQSLDRFVVAVEDGAIVSHVGAFPMAVWAGPARISCCGIGGVATLPEARGKGHMTHLMSETLRRMRARGESLSILWGDRQRYGHFGYETCGLKTVLTLTLRSLSQSGVQAVAMQEVNPLDPKVVAHIQGLQGLAPFRVERPWLDLTLARQGVRAFVCDDGYLLARHESRDLEVQEAVSASGNEPGMLLGALQRSFGGRATIEVASMQDKAAQRLARGASGWRMAPQGMMRVVDWPLLASSLKAALEQNAAHVKPFSVSVGCEGEDGVEWATIKWNGESLEVSQGRRADETYILGPGELAAHLFGGALGDDLGALSTLLPLAFHIPKLDDV